MIAGSRGLNVMVWCKVILSLCWLFRLSDGLHIEDVTFPLYATLGQTITMDCMYKLSEGEYVDSIKWYKDNEEFYRILPNPPREQDKVVIFEKPGIKLDRQKSGLLKAGTHQLVLEDLTLEASGRYMCQITESKPPFHTAQMEKNLHVIIRPEAGPEIKGLRNEYTVDEVIDVICTSARSYPASQLDFFINDEPVGEHLKTRYPNQTHADGLLQTASIGLQYPVKAKNIVSDELSIKCTAKIWNAYWQSVVQKTTLKRLGRMLESRSGASSTTPAHQATTIGQMMGFSIALVHLLFGSSHCRLLALAPNDLR